MAEQSQVEKARHQWRVRMVLVILGFVVILALSLWIRAGHNSLLADAAAVVVVIAVGFLTRRTNDSRAANDPAFAKGYNPAARAAMPFRFIGNGSGFLLATILLMLPVGWGLAYAVRWFSPLKHLLAGATLKEILVLSFAIAAAIAGGFTLWVRRLWSKPRSTGSESSDNPEQG